MVRAGRRVVAEPRQRIIDALGGEGRERRRFARRLLVFAIGDLVVRVVEVGRVEQVAQGHVGKRGAGFRLDIGAFAKSEMQRDRRRRFRDEDRNIVVSQQQVDLLLEIMPEQFRAGDGRRVDAGRRDVAVGQA